MEAHFISNLLTHGILSEERRFERGNITGGETCFTERQRLFQGSFDKVKWDQTVLEEGPLTGAMTKYASSLKDYNLGDSHLDWIHVAKSEEKRGSG